MYSFFCFWWRCTRLAARSSAAFANNWMWLVGVPIVTAFSVYIAAQRRESALTTGNPALDGLLAGVTAFAVTWVISFVIRLLNAPVTFLVAEKNRANTFNDEVVALRAQINNPIPDLAIDTRRAPEIFTRPDDDAIVHILIGDFHLTNRSDVSASIEIRLKFNIGGTTISSNQDSPLDLAEMVKEQDPSIGRHLGRRISLSAYEGVTGYLAYRIFDPVTRAIAAAHSMQPAEFLNTLSKPLKFETMFPVSPNRCRLRPLGLTLFAT
jgi:hypothetical protein